MPGAHRLLLFCVLARASSRPALTSHWRDPRAHFSSVTPPPASVSLSTRWLSELKARIGRCLLFGLKSSQIDEAGRILRIVAEDWRELLAGSEGFLVGKGRAGLEGQEVVWGEMVHILGKAYLHYLIQADEDTRWAM